MYRTKWNDDEIFNLKQMFLVDGLLLSDISIKLNRPIAGVSKKIKSLSLIRPADLKHKIKIESVTGEKNGMYGKQSWCKGLTKETNLTIKEKSKLLSLTRKNLFISGKLDISGEKNGMYGKHSWNNGLTKFSDERLKLIGKKLSQTRKIAWNALPIEEKEKRLNLLTLARNKCKTKKPTKIEIFIENILIETNIEFNKQYQVGYFIADFFIPSLNLLIECQGDYWHANPEIYKDLNSYTLTQINNVKRDLRKKEFYDTHNYKSLFLWENEINQNPDKIKYQLTKMMST